MNKPSKFKILTKELLYDSFLKIFKIKASHERYDGGEQTVIREINYRRNAVAVVIEDVKRNEICLIEQFRPAPIFNDDDPWMLELPAGIIDEGETPEEAAVREAQEEACVHIDHLTLLTETYPSSGGLSEKLWLYSAVGSNNGETAGGEESEGEDIRIEWTDTGEVREMLMNGEFKNGMTAAALGIFFLKQDDECGH